jgi:hypothetical protein
VYIHHPKFGALLKDKMDGLGVECVVKYREDYDQARGRNAPVEDYVRFFKDKLGVTSRPRPDVEQDHP